MFVDQFIQPRICAGTSQILLIAEQNLIFCSRPQREMLRNGGKNGKYEQITGYVYGWDCNPHEGKGKQKVRIKEGDGYGYARSCIKEL